MRILDPFQKDPLKWILFFKSFDSLYMIHYHGPMDLIQFYIFLDCKEMLGSLVVVNYMYF